MKIKVVFSVVILFSVMAFIFTKPSKKENSESLTTTQLSGVNDSSFIIGACADGNDTNYSRLTDSLGFNLWFRYLSGFESNPPDYYIYPKGWTNDDRVMNMDSTPYLQSVRDILSSNADAKMNTIMQRPKTEWLAFGQRSDYQCENVQNTDLWFYGYADHPKGNDKTDTTAFGNGLRARFCKFGVDDTGYVVKGLIANREQINVNNIFSVPYPGFGDKQFDWYIKPRIRIDTNDANPSISVCRIEVLDFDANIIKSVIIKGINFRDYPNDIYDGRYLDEFFRDIKDSLKIPGDRSSLPKNAFNPRGVDRDSTNCKVDFRVFWLGECDMWIDYVRVEDERAHGLFNPSDPKYDLYQQMLRLESKLAYDNNNTAFRFYTEEFQFNHLPCLKYVYDYIKQNSGVGASFYGSPGGVFYSDHTPNRQSLGREHYKKYFIDSIKPKELIYNAYPLFDSSQTDTKIPNTLPVTIGAGILATPVSPQSYDNWLQSFMNDNIKWPYGDFINILKDLQSLCKSTSNLNFFSSIQTHLHQGPDGHLREPTNEEIEMMVNTSVSYGSKGILYFWYDAWGTIPPSPDTGCSRGLVNLPTRFGIYPRYLNEYGQLKWQKIKDIDKKLKTWGPILMRLPIANTNSYVYSNQTERAALNNNSYFWQFITLKPGTGTITCYDNPNFPQGYIPDCQSETYLQISTFGGIEPNSQYFMVVNRRCSPYINENSEDNRGGKRQILSYFHSNNSAFSDFNNWSVVNCENDSVVASFNKSNPGYVNLDWFMPGEGRLYKIVPMMSTGGILQTDESFNSDVICRKNIYNNGFNITIGTNANVSFADSVGIYMSGGNLTIGSINDNPISGHLQFKGITSNNKWQGFVLDSCGAMQVYGGYFNNIMQNQSAFNVSNCFHYRFENNQFTCAQGENSNGININYNLTSFEDEIENAYHYIRNNNFNFTGNSNYAINITATGSASIPVLIESNTLNTNYGIFVENISGGAINQNSISNYSDGITLLSSSCDFYQNTLTSSETDATGIKLLISTSVISPTSSNGYFVGGLNNLSSLGSNSSNIKVEDSYFNIDNGYNVFDIDFENSPRHITGYFPSTSESEYKAGYNCFKNNSVIDTASIYVTQGSGEEAGRITFNTDPPYCGTQEFANYEVFNLAGNINDTIYYRSGGTGGGYKDGQAMAIETQTTYKLLKDSISLNLRKHFYNLTELECREMLLNYPDSSESIGMVSKLYLSSLTLDSAGNHIQSAKTFFENLILNNPNNTPLIKRANYFVQKCKVALKQYTSALQGFQEIINQNPYSYEGLIASWDYAATQLLANSGGSYPDEEVKSNEEESEISSYNINYLLDSLRNKKSTTTSYSTENYDTKKFTKQDRESINSNVTNAFKNERTKQIEKIQELEKKITTLSNNNSKTKPKTKNDELVLSNAKKELKTMKTLSEVVKVKKPKNINEHIKNINSDIKKVFTIEKTPGSSKTNNLIPLEYNLSQNYPNPFNPNTKINYELPKDGKVKLVIYDILGRQIKSLVNNEFKTAGRYTVEFNGSQYASGVYFYRIQVEDGKGFTAVKKMVLIK